jgi:hypothetical protein
MSDLEPDRTAEDDRIEKRDDAYAIALQEAEQRRKQDEEQAALVEAEQQQADQQRQSKGSKKT